MMTDFERVADFGDGHENVIHFLTGMDECAFTLHQGRYVTKVKKLAAEHPDKVKITHENKDGSIVGRMPVKWAVKLSAIKPLTEEQKERLRAQGRDALTKLRGETTEC